MSYLIQAGRLRGTASLLALGAVMWALPVGQAQAQTGGPLPAASADAPADGAGEIVVTGSRIARLGFEAPTPVTVVGQERLQQNGDTNVGDALNRLPSFRPQSSGAVLGFTQLNAGSLILDLRGLGQQRTLVLLDGRRIAPSTTQGTIDINLIPSNIISRAEVVTGGASAAYGSDAVAGVVNMIIDTKLTGLKAEAQFGVSNYGDNKEYQVNAAFGSDVAGGRGHFVGAVEYVDSGGMGDCFEYKWCSPDGNTEYFSTVNPGGAGANGLPSQVLGYATLANMTEAGLIATTALRGRQFNPDGSLSTQPFTFGINASPTATFHINGSGRMYQHDTILLKAPFSRFTAFGHLDYDLTDAITAFAETSFGRVTARANGAQPFDNALVIRRDNAFLPAAVAALMDSAVGGPITTFNMGRKSTEGGLSKNRARRTTYRIVGGLRGDLGNSWKWDTYYQYGETEAVQTQVGNRINANFTRALDSVRNASGQAVCRSSLTDPGNGCAPFNPFGIGQASAQSVAYAFGTAQSTFTYKQHVGSANLSGEPFSTWAGPVSFATGAEYRVDTALGTSDSISSVSGFFTNNAAPIDGKIKVLEGYAEAAVPLASDWTLAQKLELNGAVRQTHYNRQNSRNAESTVNATTWKIGAIWEPVKGIRLRATRSRDIRAPNMVELFSLPASTQTFIADPVTRANQNVTTFTGGNAALAPEKANTKTAGIVLTPDPSWVGGNLSLSVDYYHVKVAGAVATLGGQTLVNRCVAGAQDFCRFLTRDPASNLLTRIDNVNLNLNSLIAEGIDIELLYALRLDSFSSLPGTLTFRALATHNMQLSTIDSSGLKTNRAGMNGYPTGQLSGVPDWTTDFSVSYRTGPASFTVQARSLTKGLYDVTLVGPEDAGYAVTLPNSINTNRIAGRTYINLSASYQITPRVEMFGIVNNVFHETPPPAPTAVAPYNPVLYDPTGRYFRVGVRAAF